MAIAIRELRKAANPSAVYETLSSGDESEGDNTKSTSNDSGRAAYERGKGKSCGKFGKDKGGTAEGVKATARRRRRRRRVNTSKDGDSYTSRDGTKSKKRHRHRGE